MGLEQDQQRQQETQQQSQEQSPQEAENLQSQTIDTNVNRDRLCQQHCHEYSGRNEDGIFNELFSSDPATYDELEAAMGVIPDEEIAARAHELLLADHRYHIENPDAANEIKKNFAIWYAKQDKVERADRKEDYEMLETMVKEIDPDGYAAGEYKIDILAKDDVNAFASATHIAVNEGLLDKYKDRPDIVRYVIAHEIAHQMLDHYKRGALAFEVVKLQEELNEASKNDPEFKKTAAQEKDETLNQLAKLYISRVIERDADLLAAKLLKDAGYDMKGAHDYHRETMRLQREANEKTSSELGISLNEMEAVSEMSGTHPSGKRRIKYFPGE